jgi:hypothetical protein
MTNPIVRISEWIRESFKRKKGKLTVNFSRAEFSAAGECLPSIVDLASFSSLLEIIFGARLKQSTLEQFARRA